MLYCVLDFSSLLRMAGHGAVFHVEFGINETQLTRAIESKQFDRAAQIVRENSFTSFLDEGTFFLYMFIFHPSLV